MDLLSTAAGDGVKSPKEEENQVSMKEIENWLDEPNDESDGFIMMIYGVDGTMKTGILMEYLARRGLNTLYLDIDGNSRRIWKVFHHDAPIHIKNPLETKLDWVKGRPQPRIDYLATFEKLRMALQIAAENPGRYDAVVIDGISTLLSYAAQQTKIDHYIDADGKVAIPYWEKRKIHFMNIIEMLRAIQKASIFLVGHDDFINIPGTKKVDMGKGNVIEVGKTSKPVTETNRMMDQRIYTELVVLPNGGEEYYATIHKWRDDGGFVNEKILIAEKSDDGFGFHSDNIMSIFEHDKIKAEEKKKAKKGDK